MMSAVKKVTQVLKSAQVSFYIFVKLLLISMQVFPLAWHLFYSVQLRLQGVGGDGGGGRIFTNLTMHSLTVVEYFLHYFNW